MIFSERKLQEKCNEQTVLLYTAYIDLIKGFDFLIREGLFTILLSI